MKFSEHETSKPLASTKSFAKKCRNLKICYGRGNVLVRKCPVGEVSFGEMSSRGIVRSGKCPSGRCPSRKCQSGICPRRSVSRGSVRSGNCPTISVSMLFLTKYESNLIVHGFCPFMWPWGQISIKHSH